MSSTGALVPQMQVPVDLDTLTSRWLGALAPATRTGYAADARAWLSYASSSGIDPKAATGRDLAGWVATLDALAPSTRARRVAGVRSFYAWLRDEGIVTAVPELPRGARPRVRGQDDARLVGLSSSEASRLMSAADVHSPRMAALVSVLLTTGLRIHEALALTVGDLRVGGGGRVTATITGKGERVRTVVVPPLAVERLDVIRPADEGVYFRTRTGRPWDQREARDSLSRVGRKLGMDLHPHVLRHTAASLALAGGANVEAVRAMLGHSSLTTTQRYVRAAGNLDASPAYALAATIAPTSSGDGR
ncbi:hypothetical protein C1N80_09040 [Brachybacterium sp. SGAir0954]|uniref:tyrosine-type recombinase/integrase n=1 Tax=Brachybacterium sp. SGAir0954 TaxID=2571029 RepID=UPI0010CD42E5|nr:tyrosine-type recombinase/integrase [Brachybacterium sp. SGAir0954]QCR53707.1 hypothetical protein C1N80_09040 [Brachybacterium sp. SGAir0954]